MQITIEKHNLFEGVQRVQNVVDRKNTIPVLSNILLESEADTSVLQLTATNLEVGISTKLPVSESTEGSITIPAQKIFEILRELPEASLALTVDENNWVTIDCAEANFKLAGLPKTDFPELPLFSSQDVIVFQQPLLREMIAKGDLGQIRFVNAEYPQDWLATFLEETGQKQAAWRADPEQTGISNCVGDIGSHIKNMASYLTGLKIQSLSARLDTFVEGRVLDDNASILVNYDSGAKGLYWSSQIAVGHDNGLRIRIYGTKGSLEWAQEDPNYARISYLDKPTEIISRGRDDLYPHAQNYSRIPAGHPEGYFEAFANIYSTFITALNKKLNGESLSEEELDYPGVDEGVQGVKFIEKCVESSKKGAAWIDF